MVIINDALNLLQIHRLESARARQRYRFELKLCFSALLADMNVRWLIKIGLIKPELVTLDAQDNRHKASSTSILA